MIFELLLKVMERVCEIPTRSTPSTVVNLFCLTIPQFEIFSLQSSNRWAHLHESYRTLLDGSLGRRCPRHFVPGYDHAVPLGRDRFRAEALIKLALMGFSLWVTPSLGFKLSRRSGRIQLLSRRGVRHKPWVDLRMTKCDSMRSVMTNQPILGSGN